MATILLLALVLVCIEALAYTLAESEWLRPRSGWLKAASDGAFFCVYTEFDEKLMKHQMRVIYASYWQCVTYACHLQFFCGSSI